MASKRSRRGKKVSSDEESDLESLKDSFEEDEKSFSEDNSNESDSSDDGRKKKVLI